MSLRQDSILLVGLTRTNQESIAHTLNKRGWKWRTVDSLTSAVHHFAKGGGVQLVLAAEALLDGRGYELTDAVTKLGSSLLVGVMLSEGSVWLPVVERGERTFGRGGIGLAELGSVLDELLDDRVSSNVSRYNSRRKAVGTEQPAGVSHRVVTAH